MEKQLEEEQTKLSNLQNKVNKFKLDPDPELLKKWEIIEKDIIAEIKKNLDVPTQFEQDLSQSTLNNIYDSIRRDLREKNYYKAYLIVKHTERQYPEAKLLRCSMEKSDQVILYSFLLVYYFYRQYKNNKCNGMPSA